MPAIGDKFSTLMSQLVPPGAKQVRHMVDEGGKDGLWGAPVTDTLIAYDVDGDGRPDVNVRTREQDVGAWSRGGEVGIKGVTSRRIELLDKSGRVTDAFEELSAHRCNGRIESGESRGGPRSPQFMTDLVRSIEHIDYLPEGRNVTISWAGAKDDGLGNVALTSIYSGSTLYRP